MTDKLLNCPFCGRKAELRHNDGGFSYVLCANDGCYVRTDGHLNDDAAIKAWNTRKPMDRIVEEIESMFNVDPIYYGEEAKWAVDKAIEIVKAAQE